MASRRTDTKKPEPDRAPVKKTRKCLMCRGEFNSNHVGERVCPVRGRVSMDQISIDLTDCPEAEAGDLVEVISTDPAAPNSLEALAIAADTIPYELMCRLGARVRRTLVE